MRPFQSPGEPVGETDAIRRRLYAGAGLCLGSALGGAGASTLGVPAASLLFGAAVPVLAVQVWREHRLLRRYRHPGADVTGRETAQ